MAGLGCLAGLGLGNLQVRAARVEGAGAIKHNTMCPKHVYVYMTIYLFVYSFCLCRIRA